ncbi:MAG: elongation factor P [Planctomycetaceae bacterium]|nr:elongation factor P [Planctomycetales bacterium]MCB9873465.1 elongation factor P [Planctomycetaceae bacterium]MCB9940375.1 elongation factor P [Planctomycetaceae bacterium]
MLAKEIKPGAVVVYDGSPILIESMNVQSPSARGAATLYKFRGRNLATKQKTDITLKGGESLNEADFQRRPVKLMYSDATDMHFLDDQDFNEWVLPLEDVGEAINFITEGLEGILCLIYNDECIGVQLPTTIELTIAECDPGVRGNSATGRTKPAKLETGLIVQVPEFIKQGERIKVDSRTSAFLSRA